MRILMIAPQPFFEPRGVPFSVYYHIRALGKLGHEVDLVTYPLGRSIDLPGLRIFRAPRIPFIRKVKVGPSLAKVPLDLLVFLTTLWRLCLRRYRYIYTHEEAGLIGVLLAPPFGCKHLYYMHSDLSQQMMSSGHPRNTLLLWCVERVQRLIVRHANAVIAICPAIEERARRIAPGKPIYMIENVAVNEDLPAANSDDVELLRQKLHIGTVPVLLYTGTLESYQGLHLLLLSIALVREKCPTAHYVVVGGRPEQVANIRGLVQALGIAESISIVERRPPEEMATYMALANVLVSPRCKGTNTPLKLYTYLLSGKPVLATDILSHTQVLTPEIAMLVPPTPEGLALGALALLEDPALARTLGARGKRFAEEHYSWSVFLEKISAQTSLLAPRKRELY